MTMKEKLIQTVMIIFIISIMIEMFIFNMRFFQSALYDEIPFGGGHVLSLEGGHMLENGDIELDEENEYLRLTVGNIEEEIKNVRLDVEIMDEPVSWEHRDHVCDVAVTVWDDAIHERMGDDGVTYPESGMYDLTEKKVLHSVKSSQYIWLQTYGKTKALQFDISSDSGLGRIFRIHNITFNATEGLHINAIRLIAVFFALLIVYLTLFWKKNWEIDCVTPAMWKRVLPAVFLVLVAVAFFYWVEINPSVKNTSMNEYDELAAALLNGKVYVGEGSELVKSMEGNIVFWNIDSREVKFDYAYYNGKYYVYFGILPCIIFYVPYRLVTGSALLDYIPVVILCLVTVAEIYLFLGMVIRRYYRKIPFFVRLLMTGAAAGGMYIPLCISAPNHYMIPILSGLVLTLAGAMCWLKGGLYGSPGQNAERRTFRTGYIAAGSVCMAAVSLCRPTMLLMGILLISVCVVTCRQGILAQSKRDMVKNGLAVFIPYFVFASVCMYYNYIRFDSPFDFGAAKNMTTIPFNGGNGYLPYQILRSLYEYLFAPAVFTPEFPFFTYQGLKQIMDGSSLIAETKPDIGLFTGAPVLWAGILCVMYRKNLKEKHLWYPMIALLVCAPVLMSFATRFSFFITERYSFEFSFIFFLWSFTGIMELMTDLPEKSGENLMKAGRFVAVSLLLLALFFGFLQLFPENNTVDLSKGNTEVFYRIYYSMNFML